MIIGTFETLEIGSRQVGLWGPDGRERPDMPFVVMREVTRGEWMEGLKQDGTIITPYGLRASLAPNAKFYEVSVD